MKAMGLGVWGTLFAFAANAPAVVILTDLESMAQSSYCSAGALGGTQITFTYTYKSECVDCGQRTDAIPARVTVSGLGICNYVDEDFIQGLNMNAPYSSALAVQGLLDSLRPNYCAPTLQIQDGVDGANRRRWTRVAITHKAPEERGLSLPLLDDTTFDLSVYICREGTTVYPTDTYQSCTY